MMHKQPHNDTTNPPGQIVNLEVPLGRAIEAFKALEIDGLRARVHQLEQELKHVRKHNIELYLELEGKGKIYSSF